MFYHKTSIYGTPPNFDFVCGRANWLLLGSGCAPKGGQFAMEGIFSLEGKA
jgi:hypothetical protein